MSNLPATPQPERAMTAFSQSGISLCTFDDAARFARAVYESGLAPKGFQNAQAVMVALQAGMELGLPPMRAIQSVAVVNGRPAIWGDAMLAVANASGLVVDVEETVEGEGDSRKATCTVHRRDGRVVARSFSVADAKAAGLWGKSGPWTQYPARMLQMRARSFAIRDAIPEAMCGFTSREEMEDVVAQQRTPRDVTPQKTPDPLLQQIAKSQETIDEDGVVSAPEPIDTNAILTTARERLKNEGVDGVSRYAETLSEEGRAYLRSIWKFLLTKKQPDESPAENATV